MDKRSKDALRRYKKSRQQAQSSSDSSSSDSDSSGSSSYSSSESDCHRKKKARQGAGSSSSSADERHKREKREHCQKKLEAKRNHLKRKLKEAKLKKRAAAALSGHSHRALSPATQAKLKKLAERRHQRAASKERREREREKHRAAAREREHHRVSSRSPNKITKIRIHQDVKRQKSPPRMHHQLMSREKIIIQTRTRDRTPSAERERLRHEHKMLARERERRERDRERAEREAARDKERAEALARCQERQRERERLAREKMRREEEEKKYGSGSIPVERGDHLLPRPPERDLGAARGYGSRERSLEARRVGKRDMVDVYEREREYMEAERRGLLDREDLRRDRDFLATRHREMSPVGEHYAARIRDPRELYSEDRERPYNRPYIDDARHAREHDTWINPRDLRERETIDLRNPREFRDIDHEIVYPDERERIIRNRERSLAMRDEWKSDWDGQRDRGEWDADTASAPRGFVGGPKRGGGSGAGNSNIGPPVQINPPREQVDSEPDWDADELPKSKTSTSSKTESGHREGVGFSSGNATPNWSDPNDLTQQREKPAPSVRSEHTERRWPNEWREGEETAPRGGLHQHRSERGGRGFRRGGGNFEHLERGAHGFRSNPPPLMTLPVQPPGAAGVYHSGNPRFPNKRNMTYTNPNLLKKQQAALAAAKAAAQASAVAAASTAVAAAKAAAQSAANATTNPSILGQFSGTRPQHLMSANADGKAEHGEVNAGPSKSGSEVALKNTETTAPTKSTATNKTSGELSEISDSDDDILNKTEKRARIESDGTTRNTKADGSNEQIEATAVCNEDIENTENRPDDDEMLDFEEISDGELEEDARNKGVGDALGVDWASLIAETKRQADIAAVQSSVGEQPTTAKQKWQPHRVILDVGISMLMAGEEFTKRLLTEAKQKLDDELDEIRLKSEIKDEITSTADEDSQTVIYIDDSTTEIGDEEKKSEDKAQSGASDEIKLETLNIERLHPIACIQVAERMRQLERRKLIVNACGTNTRALCARQDLKLRRQLCGLPAQECNFPNPIPKVSEKLKAMALAAFQRTLEVK